MLLRYASYITVRDKYCMRQYFFWNVFLHFTDKFPHKLFLLFPLQFFVISKGLNLC